MIPFNNPAVCTGCVMAFHLCNAHVNATGGTFFMLKVYISFTQLRFEPNAKDTNSDSVNMLIISVKKVMFSPVLVCFLLFSDCFGT